MPICQAQCSPERFDRIMTELGEMRAELRVALTKLEEHEQEIERMKLEGATHQGSDGLRDRIAARVFQVLPPLISAAVGLLVGKFIR